MPIVQSVGCKLALCTPWFITVFSLLAGYSVIKNASDFRFISVQRRLLIFYATCTFSFKKTEGTLQKTNGALYFGLRVVQ